MSTSSEGRNESTDAASSPEYRLVCEAVEGLADAVTWEPPGTACVDIKAAKERSKCLQVVFGGKNRQGQPVVCVRAECGPATPTVTAVMFRYNVTLRYGRFDVEKGNDGSRIAVLRHCVARAGLTPAFLRDIIQSMFTDTEQLRCELALDEQTYPWQATDPSAKEPWH